MKKIPLIYLLGTSFSGSTLIGYLIGALDEVFNTGELMLFPKKKDIGSIPCFCQALTKDCRIWKHMDLPNATLYSKPDLKTKVLLLLKLLIGQPVCRIFHGKEWDDTVFCPKLVDVIRKEEGKTVIILDTSKSLFRLMYLICSRRFDVKIVYIKRDILGNISSFVKNGDSVFKGLINYKLNHFFMPLFLKRHGLNFHYLSYKSLCAFPDKELRGLGRFLGLDLDYDRIKSAIRHRQFHVFTGSNTRVQFRDFKGIRYDRSWKRRLSQFQIFCIKCMSTKSEK